MFTDTQLAQYEKQGAVTIDSPFTTEQLDRAEAAWDRLKKNGGEPYEDPDYIEVIQHPYFEEVAKKVLLEKKWKINRSPAERCIQNRKKIFRRNSCRL